MANSNPLNTDAAHPNYLGSPARPPLDAMLAVGVGGAVGTLARYGAARAFPAKASAFPWTTLSINLVGCLLFGVALAVAFEHRPSSPLLRPFLAVGVLGGFTTFSTFAVETMQRSADRARLAALYVALSVVGGLFAVLLGACTVRRRLDTRGRA